MVDTMGIKNGIGVTVKYGIGVNGFMVIGLDIQNGMIINKPIFILDNDE